MHLAAVAWIALWTLVAAGALLAVIAVAIPIRPLVVLLSRKEPLERAQLLLDLSQLDEYGRQLEAIPGRLEALGARAAAARRSLADSVAVLRLPQALAALQGAAIAVRALAKTLGG